MNANQPLGFRDAQRGGLRILRKAKDLRAARSFAPRRMKLKMLTVDEIVRRALEEDLPDITSEAIFARGERGRARFIAKADGVVAGFEFARRTFELIDST